MQTIDHGTGGLHLGDGPFIFSGRPPICMGTIEIGNSSRESVRLRAIPTEHRADERLVPPGFGEIRVQGRLAAGARGAVPAHLQIDPHTAPGRYETSIPWGEERRRVVVYVQENPALNFSPSRVRLRGAGGDRLSQTLVIHNTGNVAHTLDEVATVWLEERDWVGRSLVYTLRESPGNEKVEQCLERLLKELRESMLPQIRVSLKYDTPRIEPGDTRVVEIGLTLPSENMAKGRTYLGFVKLMGKRLWLELTCDGSPKSPKRRPQ